LAFAKATALIPFILLAVVLATLQGFMHLDWGRGVERFFLLLSLVVVLVCGLTLRPPRVLAWRFGSRFGWMLLLITGVLVVWHVSIGVRSAEQVYRTHAIPMDQGQATFGALALLERGGNPYAIGAMLDPVQFRWNIEHFARCIDDDTKALQITIDRFWSTLRWEWMADLEVHVADRPQCEEARRLVPLVGYKYGPVLLLGYAPFQFLLDEAGLFVAHLAFVAALLAVLGAMAREAPLPGYAQVALAFAVVLVPTHLRWNVLRLTATDTLPIVLALWGCLAIRRGRDALGGALIGLSIGAKLLPGLLFVPLLSRSRRSWVVLAIIVALSFGPFLVWDARGFTGNILLYNLLRHTDSTALAHFVPRWVMVALKPVFGLFLLGAFALGHRSRWGLDHTLVFLLIAVAASVGTGPIFHNNYLIWVLPIFGLAVARILTRAQLGAEVAWDG
jgi:glycosyl transferase family 87